MCRPVVILGGGGHGRVVFDTLREMGIHIAGVIDPNLDILLPSGLRLIGPNLSVARPADCLLAMGVGSTDVGARNLRPQIFENAVLSGFSFISIRHPSSVVSSDVKLSEGVQLMAGSVLQPGSIIGRNVIVNTKASIDHDCRIGDHVHIAPGATLSGGVEIGAGSHVGVGAIVVQGLSIGHDVMVGAGVVITRGVAPGSRVRREY